MYRKLACRRQIWFRKDYIVTCFSGVLEGHRKLAATAEELVLVSFGGRARFSPLRLASEPNSGKTAGHMVVIGMGKNLRHC